jgi:glucose uptake protein GlcU
MTSQQNFWHYLAMLPAGIAAAGSLLCLSLFFLLDDSKMAIVISFAVAELCMVLAGGGGVTYLLNPRRTAQDLPWLWGNIGLFFISAFSGLALFMAL